MDRKKQINKAQSARRARLVSAGLKRLNIYINKEAHSELQIICDATNKTQGNCISDLLLEKRAISQPMLENEKIVDKKIQPQTMDDDLSKYTKEELYAYIRRLRYWYDRLQKNNDALLGKKH